MGGILNLNGGTALRIRLAFKALMTPTVFGVSALVETPDHRLALIRHRFGHGFHLPGGGVNWGEEPSKAAWREAAEEAGLISGDAPKLFGLYTRKVGIVTNVIAVFHITNAGLVFKPNMEIVEMLTVDPASPPPGTTIATKKRLAEFIRQAPVSEIW